MLLLVSAVLLFLELALIRWIPAHVLYLTFFTNTVLLASFLGIALGCLSSRRRDLLKWTPLLLALACAAAQGFEALRPALEPRLDLGGQSAPQLVFFGAEYFRADLAPAPIPVELIAGLFFVLVALVFVGPGQELGRRLEEAGGGTRAYARNLLGGLAGVLLFAAAAFLGLPPLAWFAAAAAGLEVLLLARGGEASGARARAWRAAGWLVVLAAAARTSGPFRAPAAGGGSPAAIAGERTWSPYYRVDYLGAPLREIAVNQIGHQRIRPLSEPDATYALPHLLRRDSGGAPFADVLVIGAGSGNDVARALQWGARSVDAVEIDPVLYGLGQRENPDRPYGDSRATRRIDDGRRFLRRPGKSYDLIVYALVDSLVLHSGYSNIRLESYLFTREALEDARRRLKPGGVLVVYNYFRQGWVAGRLFETLREVFGAPPIAITAPYVPVIEPSTRGGFTVFLAGDVAPIAAAFARSGMYHLPRGTAPAPGGPNGFRAGAVAPAFGCAPSAVAVPPDLSPATDDWPFLYLREPMIPAVSLRGAAVVAGAGILLLLAFLGGAAPLKEASPRMFFLGAGFMLIETKAVVTAALLLGGTWTTNVFVFAGVLLALYAANALAARLKAERLWPWYAGLFAALLAARLVPTDAVLGLPRAASLGAAGLLSLSPLVFAGVIFSTLYARSAEPAADFGANTAGALLGGLAENASMLVGFRGLALVAALFYALSALGGRSGRAVAR